MKGKRKKSLPYIKFTEDEDDPYRQNFDDGSYCTECGIVYINKNWKLDASDEFKKNKIICPACRKIKDRYYGGLLELSGKYLKEHKEEILNIVNNEEKRQRSKNALHRIAKIENISDDKILIYTTDNRLAYRIGKVVYSACKGNFTIKWADGEHFVRVYWSRDE
ncbi:MAG: BCAM0308 family protein [Deferribacterota bacterium]|nr:BCAM0308 family protein [Deferribacterota bacterium]